MMVVGRWLLLQEGERDDWAAAAEREGSFREIVQGKLWL